MLDLIDKKLLFYLDQNCRQSINEIAKKTNIHRNVALYRIKKLEKEKIIRGYFTEVNTRSLGLLTFRIFIKFANSTIDKEEKLVKYLQNSKEIIWLFRVLGKWDIDFVYVGKTPEEFDSFFRKLRFHFNEIIETHETSIMTQLLKYPKKYLIEKKTKEFAEETFNSKTIKIDETDKNILNLLSNKANIKLIELSKKININVNTIKERIKKLKKNGIIVGFRPFIDTEKTGYYYYRIHINLKHYTREDYIKIKEYIGQQPETIYLLQYIQGADIEVELHCKDEKSLQRLIKDIKENFGKNIKELYFLKFYKEYVYKYLPENI